MKSIVLLCLFGFIFIDRGLCRPNTDHDYLQDGEDGDDIEEESDNSNSTPPQKMLSKNKTLEVDPHTVVTLPCEVDGNPDTYSRIWRRGQRALIYTGHIKHINDNRINTLQNGVLEIRQVNVSDEGMYTCFISNNASVTYEVYINSPGRIAEFYPEGERFSIKEHSSLTLKCVGIGRPKPDIKWFKNNNEVTQLSNSGGALYTITNTSLEDSGSYKCSVNNRMMVHPIERSVQVVVTAPPEVKIAEGEDIVPTGEGFESTLRCIVTGPTKPQVKWYKDNVLVEQSKLVKLYMKGNNYYLRILSTKKSDLGSYKCVAKNGEGESSAVILLSGTPRSVYKEFRAKKESNNPVLVFNTTSIVHIEEYELLYKKQEENEWRSLRPSPAVANPLEGTNVYILEQEISGLEPGVYVAKLKAKNVNGWSEFSDEAVFPKAIESSSGAELRISLALIASLLFAHFYC